jgi:tRNA dimethylallyltransferase
VSAINLVAVVGPTGSGKSELGLQLAEHLIARQRPAQIVNCDSMQFYRGMDIGTAKLSMDERRGVKHHMIDTLDIRDESTAAEYQQQVRPLIEELQAKSITPILVGGSMLYIAAALNTFEFPERDAELRQQLEVELEALGSHAMHRRIAELDPIAASRIDPLNGRRVVRALEILLITGEPLAPPCPTKMNLGNQCSRSALTPIARTWSKDWQKESRKCGSRDWSMRPSL